MTADPAQIEAWLLTQLDWVSSFDLCERFFLNERVLRNTGETPGLCSDFAISSARGYKHFSNATISEFLTFAHGETRAAVTRFRRIRRMKAKRHNVLVATQPLTEADTGQVILL